jgi:hypothetical protein
MAEILRTVVLRGQHFAQIALGAYGAYISFQAIIRLQKYESTAKTLADWSSEAGRQLQLTRTTQGAGAIAVSRCSPEKRKPNISVIQKYGGEGREKETS